MVWLTKFTDMWKCGKEIFIKYMLNKNEKNKIFKDWNSKVRELSRFERVIEKKIL